jgi:phosphatidylglycerophosphate synthase
MMTGELSSLENILTLFFFFFLLLFITGYFSEKKKLENNLDELQKLKLKKKCRETIIYIVITGLVFVLFLFHGLRRLLNG